MKLQWTRSASTLALSFLALQFLTTSVCTAQYTPPTPTILPLYPRGVHFSIPHEDGISLVAYHANFNRDFEGLEAGTIARDIVKVKNNRWTYEDHTTRLKAGDVIYLWIHVVYDGLGYNLLDQVHHVTKFYNYDFSVHTSDASVVTPSPSTTQFPVGNRGNGEPTCRRSSTFYNREQPCVGTLLFEEQFNQALSDRWRVVQEFSGTPDYEFVVYQDENVRVNDGELRIRPTLLESQYEEQFVRRGNLILSGCTGRIGTEDCERTGQGFHILPPVSSGLIDTKQAFSLLYGRVQIRAKLPQGDWIYPVIKLVPVDPAYGAGYHSGELRIASVVGNRNLHSVTGENIDGHELRAGAVVSAEGPIRQDTMSKKSSSSYWNDDYHVYELEWSPSGITVRVDGTEFGRKENPAAAHKQEIFRGSVDRWTAPNAPFDKPCYLRIGVAVGGHGEFPDASTSGTHTKPWRNIESKALLNFYTAKDSWASTWAEEDSTLKVDYVKVWAL